MDMDVGDLSTITFPTCWVTCPLLLMEKFPVRKESHDLLSNTCDCLVTAQFAALKNVSSVTLKKCNSHLNICKFVNSMILCYE